MKIAIIGAGAMGAIYAAFFAEAGHEVWAVDINEAHVHAIQTQGLRVSGFSGDRVIRSIHATCSVADAMPCDLIVIATKAAGVAPAAASVAEYVHERTRVMTIQNGLGAVERIQAHLPDATLLVGVAQGFGASLKAPGHAHHNGLSLIRVGVVPGGDHAHAVSLAEVWDQAGLEARAYEDIDQLIWEKFVCNVALSGPCTVFERTVGELIDDPSCWSVALACADEAFAAGRAQGVTFGFEDVRAYVTAFAGKLRGAYPSMTQDHQAGRRSEIDAINGIVPEISARHGLSAPYNTVITAVVRSRERMF